MTDPTILWEGRPDWRSVAVRVFHVRVVVGYFALLLAADAALPWIAGTPPGRVLEGELKLGGTALAALGVLLLLAWLVRRTTRYTITERNVVLRYGIALPATLVIPFAAIAHMAVRVHGDHTGDLALRLVDGQRIGYAKLWPHARAGRLSRAEPMLRSVPRAGVVGALLTRALAEARDAREEKPTALPRAA